MLRHRPVPALAAAAFALVLSALPAQASWFAGRSFPIVTDEHFPADEFILSQARFWFDIYANVGEDEGLIHDPLHPEMVFRKVKVGEAGGRAGRKAVEAKVDALRGEIRSAFAKDSASRTPAERDLLSVLPSHWDSTALSLCLDRLRFQRGLKAKFRQGVERSYRYLPLIDSVFAAHGVPARLRYLPHVESSFYPHAYSKVGAAGMWQFMKSSAKRFSMKVGYLIDERRDPVASTTAAARMLAYNHRLLQSWPLAVVAYNHGPGGMANAARATGTRDMATIIKSYYSNSFGFASKNFYAEFLAASSIAMKADSIYPGLRKLEPLEWHTLVLNRPMGTRALCDLTGLSAEELEEYNLALRPATFRGKSQIPKGTAIRLPGRLDLAAVSSRIASPAQALAALAAKAPAASASATATEKASEPARVALAGQDFGLADASRREAKDKRKVEKRAAEVRQASLETKPALRPAAAPAPAAQPAPGKDAPAPLRKDPPAAAAAVTAALPAAAIPAPRPSAGPAPLTIDSSFALQVSDLDKLAHPMDRFNPAIYNLEHNYERGHLHIHVGTEETLSHYAEWAWIPERTLRGLNRLRSSRGMRMGQQVRIPMAEDKVADFVRKREEYYRGMEEDFYGSYYVSALEALQIKKGMNLWSWALEKEIPFWLLQKHNPGKVLSALQPGDSLNVPTIENGIRKWGFTRYGNSKEYLAGIDRFLNSGN